MYDVSTLNRSNKWHIGQSKFFFWKELSHQCRHTVQKKLHSFEGRLSTDSLKWINKVECTHMCDVSTLNRPNKWHLEQSKVSFWKRRLTSSCLLAEKEGKYRNWVYIFLPTLFCHLRTSWIWCWLQLSSLTQPPNPFSRQLALRGLLLFFFIDSPQKIWRSKRRFGEAKED